MANGLVLGNALKGFTEGILEGLKFNKQQENQERLIALKEQALSDARETRGQASISDTISLAKGGFTPTEGPGEGVVEIGGKFFRKMRDEEKEATTERIGHKQNL